MIKYEYEVYTASRDAQIYAGDIHDPDEVNDDTRWQDWDGDILLDVVMAENEQEAVKTVASQNDLHESTLYAVRHMASAGLPDGKARLEACSFVDDDQIGIMVSAPGTDNELYVVTDGKMISAYSNPGMQTDLYQVLSWNDEYLSMTIETSPVTDDIARSAMRTSVVTRLTELNVVDSREEAEDMYDRALSAGLDEIDELHVCDFGDTIRYGGGYEERYQIVSCPRSGQERR